MKCFELVLRLNAYIKKHGDQPVVIGTVHVIEGWLDTYDTSEGSSIIHNEDHTASIIVKSLVIGAHLPVELDKKD